MEEHFTNYNQALSLKELGFDEPCFMYENSDERQLNFSEYEIFKNDNQDLTDFIKLPLKSQVFKWFRDKHGLFVAPSVISYENDPYLWFFEINSTILPIGTYLEGTDDYKTYEESESACIDKLIELIKEEKS
jgi:hypothetical protein